MFDDDFGLGGALLRAVWWLLRFSFELVTGQLVHRWLFGRGPFEGAMDNQRRRSLLKDMCTAALAWTLTVAPLAVLFFVVAAALDA